jgi:hypothetical protein
MKIIALMPVKNEAWILRETLTPLSKICDHVIIADQNSTDSTRSIAKSFYNVKVIDNNAIGHSNSVRWLLLDAAREISGNNFIINIDADEAISPVLFKKFFSEKNIKLIPGVSFEVPWIQLWKSTRYYRDDNSVWSNNWKPIAFVDDRKCDYLREFVINDHTSRIPILDEDLRIRVNDLPLLHYQWVSWRRVQVKQAWYRCSELLNGLLSAKDINSKYSDSLNDSELGLSEVPHAWCEDVFISHIIEESKSDWHMSEILNWFEVFGVEFFKELDIWHIEDLSNEYIRRLQKLPPQKNSLKILKFLSRLRSFKVF